MPDGPLHLDDAFVALLAGLLIAAATGRTRWLAPAAVVGSMLVLGLRQPSLVPEGFVDRPAPVLALGAAGLVAGVAAGLLAVPRIGSPRTSLLVAWAGCVGVWTTAPDTEPALIGGVVLAAAIPFATSDARRTAPLAVVAPVLAGVIGTIGRPERLALVLAIAAAAMVTTRLAAFVGGFVRRQRAGTPMTVAPAATSSVTTAPAATTAP